MVSANLMDGYLARVEHQLDHISAGFGVSICPMIWSPPARYCRRRCFENCQRCSCHRMTNSDGTVTFSHASPMWLLRCFPAGKV